MIASELLLWNSVLLMCKAICSLFNIAWHCPNLIDSLKQTCFHHLHTRMCSPLEYWAGSHSLCLRTIWLLESITFRGFPSQLFDQCTLYLNRVLLLLAALMYRLCFWTASLRENVVKLTQTCKLGACRLSGRLYLILTELTRRPNGIQLALFN